jgi:hypothetical protein
MQPRSRAWTSVLAAVLGAAMCGCSGIPSRRIELASSPGADAASPPSGSAANLPPDLAHLASVRLDAQRARSASIDSTGGSISAIAADGTTFTLDVPAGAVPASQTIGVVPVAGIADLPAGGSLVAAVQFSPDGLVLDVPATLTITRPAAIDAGVTGIGWHGDAARIHGEPAVVDGRTATMTVSHFSGGGLWAPPANFATFLGCSTTDYECLTEQAASSISLFHTRAEIAGLLRSWYHDVVKPWHSQELLALADIVGDDAPAFDPLNAQLISEVVIFGAWRNAIRTEQARLHDPAFTIEPELDEANAAGAAVLRGLYDGLNASCAAAATASPGEALWAGQWAVGIETMAGYWGLATVVNRLDSQRLLDDACVKVVIDGSSAYSAGSPGDTGTVDVHVAFTIAGGPPMTSGPADRPARILVSVNLTGVNHTFSAYADADGHYSQELTWPRAMDPASIDVLATLVLGTADQPGGPLTTAIARFDRITKQPERLVFPFDDDLEGWTGDVVASPGARNWGTVYWLPKHGGTVQLDGTGGPGQPNAWISRSILLPSNAEVLRFDASAHDATGADTRLIVRLVDEGVSTTLADEVLVHRGPAGTLSFTTQLLDISAWAGSWVTIFFEQDDNGIDGAFPGGDEQLHLDNIRIVRS